MIGLLKKRTLPETNRSHSSSNHPFSGAIIYPSRGVNKNPKEINHRELKSQEALRFNDSSSASVRGDFWGFEIHP